MSLEKSILEFNDTIKVLRSENGCPWDREQTHGSLRACIMEEAAELQAAIRIYENTGDFENMKEELGDLLLQVVMQSCIAEEEGLFTLEDVVSTVQEKMIRRHPHVFGDVQVVDSGEVLKNWDEIKRQEKEKCSRTISPLREIPNELPSLTRMSKVLKKVNKIYQETKSEADSLTEIKESMEQIRCLLAEKKEIDQNNIEKSFTQVLLEVSNIAMKRKVHLEQLLNDRIEDLIEEYESDSHKRVVNEGNVDK